MDESPTAKCFCSGTCERDISIRITSFHFVTATNTTVMALLSLSRTAVLFTRIQGLWRGERDDGPSSTWCSFIAQSDCIECDSRMFLLDSLCVVVGCLKIVKAVRRYATTKTMNQPSANVRFAFFVWMELLVISRITWSPPQICELLVHSRFWHRAYDKSMMFQVPRLPIGVI